MLQAIDHLKATGYSDEEAKLQAFNMKKAGKPLTIEIKEDFELV